MMNEYVNRAINYAFCTEPLQDNDKQYISTGYKNNKDELLRVAKRKKVLPVVGKMLTSLGIDNDLWLGYYNYFKNRNVEITKLINNIFEDFHTRGIDKICVFENYGALLSAGTDIALYSSGDVDLYADVNNKKEIVDVLSGYGYTPAGDNSDLRDIMTEFTKSDGIIRINVAWKPLRRFILPFKADVSKYFKWDQMGYYEHSYIRIPSKETLLYLCFLRIAIHGYSRSPDIRLYVDTYNASFHAPSWETVLTWAERDGVSTKFLAVALIANDLVKIKVPDDVLRLARNNKYVKKIMDICYDFEAHSLKYDPSGLQLLKVEAASDDCSLFQEVLHMMFPPAKWVKEYYSRPKESILLAYVRYYKRLI